MIGRAVIRTVNAAAAVVATVAGAALGFIGAACDQLGGRR